MCAVAFGNLWCSKYVSRDTLQNKFEGPGLLAFAQEQNSDAWTHLIIWISPWLNGQRGATPQYTTSESAVCLINLYLVIIQVIQFSWWEIPHPKMNRSNAKLEFPWVFNVATHLSAGKGTWTIHWNRLVFPCPSCRYINKATYDAVDQSGRILIKMCLGPMKHMTHMTHVMAWICNLLIWNVLESEYPWSGLVWK